MREIQTGDLFRVSPSFCPLHIQKPRDVFVIIVII